MDTVQAKINDSPHEHAEVQVHRFVWRMSLYRFLDAVKLVGVIFVLLFNHNGMSPAQISILISIWSLTSLVLEVPLGTVADTYSRRNVLVVALLVHILGFALWLHGGFIYYAIGFMLWGAKNAMVSGTQEAFVYDELKVWGKEKLYEFVNAKLESAFWVGVTVSAILGGVIADINYNLIIISSIITTFLAMLTLLSLKSVNPTNSTGESKYIQIMQDAIVEIKTNKTLIGIIAFFCLIFATYGAADEYWALVYTGLGFATPIIGTLVAIGYGSFVLAGWTLHFFNKSRLQGKEQYLLLSSALIFIFAGVLKSAVSIPLIFIAMYIFKVAHLKFDAKFQHLITSSQRATISSLKSFVFELTYMVFVLLFGFLSQKIGITSVATMLGITLCIWLAIFMIIFPLSLRRILAASAK